MINYYSRATRMRSFFLYPCIVIIIIIIFIIVITTNRTPITIMELVTPSWAECERGEAIGRSFQRRAPRRWGRCGGCSILLEWRGGQASTARGGDLEADDLLQARGQGQKAVLAQTTCPHGLTNTLHSQATQTWRTRCRKTEQYEGMTKPIQLYASLYNMHMWTTINNSLLFLFLNTFIES